MNILIFDTESNGLIKDKKKPITELDNFPRVIQLSWEIVSNTSQGVLLYHKSYLIKPDGWEIPVEKFWIENGFSTEKNRILGAPMDKVLDHFLESLADCELIVAHNINFDHKVLSAEMIRYNKTASKNLPKICTMQAGEFVTKIPWGRERRPWIIAKMKSFKQPSLQALYTKLFGVGFDGAHDSKMDVKATRQCFFEMLRRGVIQLPTEKTTA